MITSTTNQEHIIDLAKGNIKSQFHESNKIKSKIKSRGIESNDKTSKSM